MEWRRTHEVRNEQHHNHQSLRRNQAMQEIWSRRSHGEAVNGRLTLVAANGALQMKRETERETEVNTHGTEMTQTRKGMKDTHGKRPLRATGKTLIAGPSPRPAPKGQMTRRTTTVSMLQGSTPPHAVNAHRLSPLRCGLAVGSTVYSFTF